MVLNSQYKVLSQINVNQLIVDGTCNQIRSIAFDQQAWEIFISTYGSEIYKIYSDSEDSLEKFSSETVQHELLMSGHFARNLKWTNEVWGLHALSNDLYLTVSDDASLWLWSAQERKQ